MDHKVIFTTAATPLLVPSFVLVGFFIALTDHQEKKYLGRRGLIWLLVQRLQSCLRRYGGLSISVMTGVCSGLFTPQQMK